MKTYKLGYLVVVVTVFSVLTSAQAAVRPMSEDELSAAVGREELDCSCCAWSDVTDCDCSLTSAACAQDTQGNCTEEHKLCNERKTSGPAADEKCESSGAGDKCDRSTVTCCKVQKASCATKTDPTRCVCEEYGLPSSKGEAGSCKDTSDECS